MRAFSANYLLSRVFCLSLLLIAQFSTVTADKYFPHSAVGDTGSVKARNRVVIAFAKGFSSPKLQGPAVATLRFFDTDGNLKPLTVRGKDMPEYDGKTVTEVSFVLSTGQSQSFELENPAKSLATFWGQILESEGAVTGRMDFTLEQNGIKATEVSAFAAERSIVNLAVGAKVEGNQHTGLAIANPSSQEAVYSVLAIDPKGEVVARTEKKLRTRGQIAAFTEELFPELGTGFTGSLQVVGNVGLSVLALNQEGIELSAVQTVGGEAAQAATPVAAGLVGDLLQQGQASPELAGAGTSGQLPASVPHQPQIRTLVTAGKVIFRKGTVTREADISADGAYYLGFLEPGEWEVSVQAPGYHELTQKVVYPRPTLDRLLVPDATELGWLSQTLSDQTITKPLRQFGFYFESAGTQTATTQMARDVFTLWARYELPELRIEVEGDPPILGGPVRESGIPAPLTPLTVLVKADPAVTNSVVEVDSVPSTGEALGGYIRFNPDCQGCVPELARQLWKTVFGLQEGAALPEEWSPVFTQMATTAAGTVVPTALDRLYWRMIRFRPSGTRVSASGEILPTLGPSTECSLQGTVTSNPFTNISSISPQNLAPGQVEVKALIVGTGDLVAFGNALPLPSQPVEDLCDIVITFDTPRITARAINLSAFQRQGDFSDWPANLLDPITGQPFPGNVIPQSRLGPGGIMALPVLLTTAADVQAGQHSFTISVTGHSLGSGTVRLIVP